MAKDNLDLQSVLDGLGQGVLIFDKDGTLISENLTARSILGTDLNLLREQGWSAAVALFDTKLTDPDAQIDKVRARAVESERPVRFQTYRAGEYLPCWAAAVQGDDGAVYTMITLDVPDWTAMSRLIDRFRSEMRDAVDSTQGHFDLIQQAMNVHPDDAPVDQLTRRISGFGTLVSVHMHRVGRLLDMLERLEDIRTGKLRELAQQRRRRIPLADYFEDFVEELDEIMLVDPETEAENHRSRVQTTVPDGLAVNASSFYLTRILHDILRNAIMYSMKATPVTINARKVGKMVQIDLKDEGYGVREKERDSVFEAFRRARQPQIIGEFGYGLSLYLCKHEVEAMNGQMWFDSTEGVGTTFSIKLPAFVDEAAASSASDSSSQT